MSDRQIGRSKRTAFMLSQLGSLSASRFAARTKRIGLTPGEAGVLRLLGHTPGINQRVLADRLGSAPSRVVALIDSLEKRDLVVRTRSATDRRNQELSLTETGRDTVGKLREIAEAHEADILAPLTDDQSTQLTEILTAMLEDLDLDHDLHRGT